MDKILSLPILSLVAIYYRLCFAFARQGAPLAISGHGSPKLTPTAESSSLGVELLEALHVMPVRYSGRVLLLFFAVCVVCVDSKESTLSKDPFFKLEDPLRRAVSDNDHNLELNRNKTVLQQSLLESYKKFVPPAGGASVEIQLALYSIVEVSTQLQTIKLQGWWRHYWKDERLAWDNAQWGISALVFWIEEIWAPDDIVYEQIEEDQLGNIAVTVYPDGNVFYSAPRITTVGCDMELTKFPYDIQTCEFTVGSMSFDGSLVDILPRGVANPEEYFEEAAVYQDKAAVDLSQFRANKEFALTTIRIVSENFYYNCCPEPYPIVVFEITVQRQTLTFLSGILIPILAVTYAGFFVLLMPATLSGARVLFAVSAMYTNTAIYNVAARNLPEVGEFTMIGRMYMASLVAALFSILISVISSSINLVVSEQIKNRTELLAVFRFYDKDRSGALDSEEADRALSALGLVQLEREYVFEQLKTQDAEEIGFHEWLAMEEELRALRWSSHHSIPVAALVTLVGHVFENNAAKPPHQTSDEDPPAPEPLNTPKAPDDVAEAGWGVQSDQGQVQSVGAVDPERQHWATPRRGSGMAVNMRTPSGGAVRTASMGATRLSSLGSVRRGSVGSVRRGSVGGGVRRESLISTRMRRASVRRMEWGQEQVQRWLADLNVDTAVRARMEEEEVDLYAMAAMPMETLYALGIRDLGTQERLRALSKDALSKKQRQQHGDDPLCVGGAAFGADNTEEPQPEIADTQQVVSLGGPGELEEAQKPEKRAVEEDGEQQQLHTKFKHLGAWLDCAAMVILPLLFTLFLLLELTSGLDFRGSAVDVEAVKTRLELVDLRRDGNVCFANTQSIALPAAGELCPNLAIR